MTNHRPVWENGLDSQNVVFSYAVFDGVRSSGAFGEISAEAAAAAARGMRSLRDDGAKKVLAGVTTVEEVLRVTQDDMSFE